MDGWMDGWMDVTVRSALKTSITLGALENKVRLIILRVLKTYPVKFFAFTWSNRNTKNRRKRWIKGRRRFSFFMSWFSKKGWLYSESVLKTQYYDQNKRNEQRKNNRYTLSIPWFLYEINDPLRCTVFIQPMKTFFSSCYYYFLRSSFGNESRKLWFQRACFLRLITT